MHITSSFASAKPCHLLRESYWEDGKVKKRTLANLSALPQPLIDLLRKALRDEFPAADPGSNPVRVRAARQHGAVSAILALARRLGFERLLFHQPGPARSRALAMIVCRLVKPGSELRAERELGPVGQTTLAGLLDLRDTPGDELCAALDWLADREQRIERKLAKRHLQEGALALCTVFSSSAEGSRCPDRPRTVYGLLCDPDGCPVAVQHFAVGIADTDTLASQVARLRDRFGLQRVAVVGDWGMIDRTCIEADLEPAGFDWVTALDHDAIHELAERKVIQPDLAESRGFASVTAPDFPGERLLVCYNPRAAAERNATATAPEARFEGLYVIRTNLSQEELEDATVIAAYNSLAQVERAFRSLKTKELQVRPIFHGNERRERAHVFLCMLAYYMEWHLRRLWAPLLCVEEDDAGRARGPADPAARGAEAADAERTREAPREGLPVQSFPDLMGNLGALTAVELEYEQVPGYAVPALSELTPLQRRAFELLDAEPHPAPALSESPEAGT